MVCMGGEGGGNRNTFTFSYQVYLSLSCVAEFYLLANGEQIRGTGTGMLEACCLYVCDM